MMKICSNLNCSHNGKPQKITNFQKDNRYSFGVCYYCKDCHSVTKKNLMDLENIPILIERVIELSKVKSNRVNRNSEKIKVLAIKIFKLGLIK